MRNFYEETRSLVMSSHSQRKGQESLALAEKLIGNETLESVSVDCPLYKA